MSELCFVNEEYNNKVMERERISSTAFGNIAIPHSLKPLSKKSYIFLPL